MKTSNIFKLNAMVTYNQHNRYHQLSITNFVGRKDTKTRQKGELFVFCQPKLCLGMLQCALDVIYLLICIIIILLKKF